MPQKYDGKKLNTRYSMFQIGFTLVSNPAGFITNIMRNVLQLSMSLITMHELPKLLLSFIIEEHDVAPKELGCH